MVLIRGGGQKSFLCQPPPTTVSPVARSPECFSDPAAADTRARARPLNEPYLRQTNPIQLRVPDNIHRDAFMAVNSAFLRARTHAEHTQSPTLLDRTYVRVCARIVRISVSLPLVSDIIPTVYVYNNEISRPNRVKVSPCCKVFFSFNR
jgi:hypothetical protein